MYNFCSLRHRGNMNKFPQWGTINNVYSPFIRIRYCKLRPTCTWRWSPFCWWRFSCSVGNPLDAAADPWSTRPPFFACCHTPRGPWPPSIPIYSLRSGPAPRWPNEARWQRKLKSHCPVSFSHTSSKDTCCHKSTDRILNEPFLRCAVQTNRTKDNTALKRSTANRSYKKDIAIRTSVNSLLSIC